MRFKGKTAIVTGAAGSIGKATAMKLAGEDARVALVDIDQDKLAQVAKTIRAARGTSITLAAGRNSFRSKMRLTIPGSGFLT